MSGNRKNLTQILRVQSAEGTKRIEVDSSDTVSQLFEKVWVNVLYLVTNLFFNNHSFVFVMFIVEVTNHKQMILYVKKKNIL